MIPQIEKLYHKGRKETSNRFLKIAMPTYSRKHGIYYMVYFDNYKNYQLEIDLIMTNRFSFTSNSCIVINIIRQ